MARLSVDIVLPRLLEGGQDETPTLTVYRGKEVARPTAAGSSYALRDENGTEIVASGPVTVGSDGVASASVAGSLTANLEFSDRWLEEWTLVIDGKIERFRCDAMLVYRKLQNVCTQKSLERLHPQLEAENLPPELTDFSGQIEEAFEQFERDLIGKGNRPNLIVSPWSCLECVRALALSYIFRDAITHATGESDRFDGLCKDYAKVYLDKFPKLVYRVDPNDEGTVSEEQETASPVLYLSGTPSRTGGGLSG